MFIKLKMDLPVWNVSLAVKQRHDDGSESRQTKRVPVLCAFGTTAQVYQMKSASTTSNYSKKEHLKNYLKLKENYLNVECKWVMRCYKENLSPKMFLRNDSYIRVTSLLLSVFFDSIFRVTKRGTENRLCFLASYPNFILKTVGWP